MMNCLLYLYFKMMLFVSQVILENYNAVIPSHARQLVMELGQNKTDGKLSNKNEKKKRDILITF